LREKRRIGLGSQYKDFVALDLKTENCAQPVDPRYEQAPWITGPKEILDVVYRIAAPSFYETLVRNGINTRGANGVYFVDAEFRRGSLVVTNRPQDGDDPDLPAIRAAIEEVHLYPLLRGRDVRRWLARPVSFVVLPHDEKSSAAVGLTRLPKQTLEFLSHFREKLRSRKKFRNFDPGAEDWYGLYSVLAGTFVQHKVVIREIASGIIAAFLSTSGLPNGMERVVIPDHKLYLIPAESEEEAAYVTGMLNCSVSRFVVLAYCILTGISTHILARLPIARFDSLNAAHAEIAMLGIRARRSALEGREDAVAEIETEVDRFAAQLWGVTDDELKAVQQALAEMEWPERGRDSRKDLAQPADNDDE
jgi:hypothetical protein